MERWLKIADRHAWRLGGSLVIVGILLHVSEDPVSVTIRKIGSSRISDAFSFCV